MRDLSIVIPFRPSSERRSLLFKWILKRYNALFPESNIIVSDSDSAKEFSRSHARNIGVDIANTKYVLLADADTICFRPFIKFGISAIEGGANWVIPYGQKGFYVLKKPYSNRLLAMDPSVFVTPDKFEWEWQLESFGGLILMRTESYHLVNGHDERFLGWGFEDNAFRTAMDTIVGPLTRVEEGWGAHLWHEEATSDTWEQPHASANKIMLAKYMSLKNDIEGMKELVKGNKGAI